MQVELHGRVALVTGAAQGKGKAIADNLAENRARDFYSVMNYDVASMVKLRQNRNHGRGNSTSRTPAMSRGGEPNLGLPEVAMNGQYVAIPRLGRIIPMPLCVGDEFRSSPGTCRCPT